MKLRKLLTKVFLAVVILPFILSPVNVQADDIDDLLAAGSYVEGEVIAAIRTDSTDLLEESDADYEVAEIMTSLTGNVDLCIVSSETMSTEELLRELSDDANVVFAEPNYKLELNSNEYSDELLNEGQDQKQESEQETETAAERDAASEEQEQAREQEQMEEPENEDRTLDKQESKLAAQPEDGAIGDLTPLQWGNWATDVTVRTDGMAENPSINVPNFGATGRDGNMDKPIVVALLDTGVYPEHPDLKNVLYHFSPEQQKALGCWEWGYNAVGKGINGNVRDEDSIAFGHGTHTAGILGAEWNGSGTSGVASNVKIVCIEIADGDGKEALADALAAYAFVDRFNEQASEEDRIRVTSNSWGEHASSRALNAVVRDLGERWGIVTVFSAGNDGKNNDSFEKTPSSLADNPYAIVVANTDSTDQLSSDTEYGTATVDLAAPGTNILSTGIEAHGSYFPDASRENNLLYCGFDGEDAFPVSVSQVFGEQDAELYDDEPEVKKDIASEAGAVHFTGSRCLKIEIDPEYVVNSSTWGNATEAYDLQFKIDLAGSDAAERLEGIEDLRFGFAYLVPKGSEAVAESASSNAAFLAEDETGENTRPVVTDNTGQGFAEDGTWGIADFIITREGPAWDSTDVPSVRPENDVLLIKTRIRLPEGQTTVYIDSIGIGTQSAPYEYASGTSMSCPAVAGAAAVLAAQGYEGIELASLVRSKVRIPEDGALAVRSGGVFDFNVSGSPDSADVLSPDIMDVNVSGSSVVVTGKRFGGAPGSAALDRYVAGADLLPVKAKIVSWTDEEVRLELEDPAEGILRVELSNTGGGHDTHMRFVSKSSNIYEQDLPLDVETEGAYNYGDGNGDWETRGPLVGLGCKLYYLPAYCGKQEDHPAYKRLLCFDLKTKMWTDLPDLPEWLEDVSAVMYDGKIVAEGASMQVTEDGEPSGNIPEESSRERVYVYDPGTGAWAQASSEGMYFGQSILNDNGQLKLAGGRKPDPEYDFLSLPVPLMSYDLSSGAGQELCSMPEIFMNPAVAARDGMILAYNGASPPAFIRIQDGNAAKLEDAAPVFYPAEEGDETDLVWGNVRRNPYLCVLAPVTDGFILAGPPAEGGASDTYILRDGSDKFVPYEKRASDDRVYSQAGCTYRGRLFVIGSAWFEPQTRLFRATAIDVPEYPGDIPCEEDVTPEPDDEVNPPDGSSDSINKVDTGDTTPVKLYLCIFAAAAAVLGVMIFVRSKRK